MGEHPAIEAEGLGKRYGPVQALAGVSLVVPSGSVLGLLGPNGAGKTTTVRMLSTLVPADEGTAKVMGFDVRRQPQRVREVIGLSGQYTAVDAYLTGRENLRMIGRLSGLDGRHARRRADALLEAFELTGAAGRTARTYSGGMRRRLDVAASLVHPPQVLFLDEPTTGLDPRGRAQLWELITGLARQGTTVLLTTQYLEEADRLAGTIVVLDRGRLVASGTPDALKDLVGGDRLELHIAPGASLRALADAVAGLGPGPATLDPDAGRLVLPVASGPALLPELAARLARAHIHLTGLALRRPSLDDVFLTLTGRPGPAAASDFETMEGLR